jgi:hypothetical protein
MISTTKTTKSVLEIKLAKNHPKAVLLLLLFFCFFSCKLKFQNLIFKKFSSKMKNK